MCSRRLARTGEAAAAVRSVRSVRRLPGYPECRYIKKDPPQSTGVTCPQCKQGEIVVKRTWFGLMYGCERYPDCDFAVNHPPIADRPQFPEARS